MSLVPECNWRSGVTINFTRGFTKFKKGLRKLLIKHGENYMKYLMLLSVLFTFNVMANDEIAVSDDLSLADEAIQAPAVNIEGQYQVQAPAPVTAPAPVRVVKRAPAPKPLTSSERLKQLRERLEERNRIMVEKKMEQIRFQQEMALARQLEASMNNTLKAIDSVK